MQGLESSFKGRIPQQFKIQLHALQSKFEDAKPLLFACSYLTVDVIFDLLKKIRIQMTMEYSNIFPSFKMTFLLK